MGKTEVLAPVGNMAMLEAGLAAGADSFYLALDDFGARAYAENFTLDNITEVVDTIHLFNRRVFIAMNILIKDEEFPKAFSYVEALYKAGVDGLILQDIGLFSVIRDKVPGMELHASTQMAVRDYYGAKYLADLGFNRVVVARETPIEEIRKIASLDVETEVFVHGSLCVSFSGECLMSSYFGGRSANRGRCAGPCRQTYELISDGKILGEDYYLNMKDLNALDNLDELLDLGVDCLKIEGRMKTPEYVFTAVSAYKQKIETGTYNFADIRDSSNRGYTKGFIFHQNKDYVTLKGANKHRSVGAIAKDKKGKYFIANSDLELADNLEITTKKNKKLPFTTTTSYKKGSRINLEKYPDAKVDSDVLLLNSSRLKYKLEDGLATYTNLPVKLEFKAELGGYPSLTITDGTHKATYIHDVKGEAAQKISLTAADVEENLSKFNDEIYTPVAIDVDIADGIFMRKKDINQCRRRAVELFKAEVLKNFHRDKISIDLPAHKFSENHKPEKNIELLTTAVSPELLADFDNIYIRTYDKKYEGLSLYLILDSHDNYDIDELIAFLKSNKIKGVVLNNYRDLNFISAFKENDIEIRIGRYLNIFNSYAFDFYSDYASSISSSVENTLENINTNASRHPVEALVYGRIELMTMRHCPFSPIKKCGLLGCPICRFNKGQMRSHDGEMLSVIRYGTYSKIYPEKVSMADISNFDENVSLSYAVMDDKDIKAIGKSHKKMTYGKGVI